MRTTATLPRRFALLGDDEGCVPLVNAILESSDHELVAAALTGPLLAAWEQAAAPRTETPDWQDWLHDPDVEGVIIAGQTSSLQEAARQLGAAGKWVVLFPQAEMGGVFATELALDDAERPQALLPVFPARAQPALLELQQRVRAGELGRLLNIQLERSGISPFTDDGIPLLPLALVDHLLLPDLDFLRTIGGNYNQVTALRTGATDSGVHATTVQLGGAGLPDATWTVRAARDSADWQLTVTGQQQRAVLRSRTETSDCELRIDQEVASRHPWQSRADGQNQLWLLDASAQRQPQSPTWTDVVRAFSLLEATHRSIRRRRTIDVHFETASERSEFKTQMAAMGCGVLLFTALGWVLLLVAGAAFDPRDAVQREAEAAGAVFLAEDFHPATHELTDSSRQRALQLAEMLPEFTGVVIVEPTEAGDPEPARPDAIASRRADSVQQAMADAGFQSTGARVVSRPVVGRWFRRGMILARALLLAPLGLFLLMQCLLVLTRGPSRPGGEASSSTTGTPSGRSS